MAAAPADSEYWTVDEAAECLEGVSTASYSELWMFVPQTGTAPSCKAVWKQLSQETRDALTAAWSKLEAEWGVQA